MRRLLQKKNEFDDREKKLVNVQRLIPGITGELEKLKEAVVNFENSENLCIEWDRRLDLLLQHLNKYLSKEELVRLKQAEEKLIQEIKLIENNKSSIEGLILDIENLKNGHDTILSDLMVKYLSSYSEEIDRLFMQISPHAIYRYVHLVPRKGKLYILMNERSSKEEALYQLSDDGLEAGFNASLMFSSGQASVLAVCIFLALNQNQNWARLRFLGIDDPFQNMDDVNVFSFIDVLSELCLKKQILISTHNNEFLNLLRSKMGLSNEQVGYINFNSYSRERVTLTSNCLMK